MMIDDDDRDELRAHLIDDDTLAPSLIAEVRRLRGCLKAAEDEVARQHNLLIGYISAEQDGVIACENCGSPANGRCSSCGEPVCAGCRRYSRGGAACCPSCMAVNSERSAGDGA